jgi:hypothetical protein
MAIGNSVVTAEETFGSVKKITFTWAIGSASSSAVTGGTTTAAYNGAVERLVTIPDGSTAPSANYDITVSDQDSTDILIAGGQNRHSANTEQVNAASLGVVANDTLTLSITGAGASCAGVVHLYIR